MCDYIFVHSIYRNKHTLIITFSFKDALLVLQDNAAHTAVIQCLAVFLGFRELCDKVDRD